MFEIRAGNGINVTQNTEYDCNTGGQKVVLTINIDPGTLTINDSTLFDMSNTFSIGEKILVVDDFGRIKTKTSPFIDEELRRNNITVQQAWDNILEAVAHYEMIKKLINE